MKPKTGRERGGKAMERRWKSGGKAEEKGETLPSHSAVISLFILLIKFPLILIKFHCQTTSAEEQ